MTQISFVVKYFRHRFPIENYAVKKTTYSGGIQLRSSYLTVISRIIWLMNPLILAQQGQKEWILHDTQIVSMSWNSIEPHDFHIY